MDGSKGSCLDTTTLGQHALASHVTVDITSEHVVRINGEVDADFTDCPYYEEWVEFAKSGVVNQTSSYFYDNGVDGGDLVVEYRQGGKQ